jgi:hypothetical protein
MMEWGIDQQAAWRLMQPANMAMSATSRYAGTREEQVLCRKRASERHVTPFINRQSPEASGEWPLDTLFPR